jgi:hypothetical protein
MEERSIMSQWLLPAAFLGIGLGFFAIFIWKLRKTRRAMSWPTVSGRIVSSAVVKSGRGEDTEYQPAIRYEYQVNGKSFGSDVCRFGFEDGATEGESEQAVGQYPAGRTVSVYVNPDEPAEAVLEPGLTGSSTRSYVVVGTVFFGMGLFILYRMFTLPR